MRMARAMAQAPLHGKGIQIQRFRAGDPAEKPVCGVLYDMLEREHVLEALFFVVTRTPGGI